jgi:beta-1,4-N-acetylglucosaminyltransferase
VIVSSRKKMPERKTVLVTVGTTLFESLVAAVLDEAALKWMRTTGYTHLVVQYGKGVRPDIEAQLQYIDKSTIPDIELYDFKPSLMDDMKSADLVVCHAGAGTLMEALTLQRKIVTVINTILMDNHQTEVAHALAQYNLVYVVESAAQLSRCWVDIAAFQPSPYQGGDPYDVPRLLDAFLGLKAD